MKAIERWSPGALGALFGCPLGLWLLLSLLSSALALRQVMIVGREYRQQWAQYRHEARLYRESERVRAEWEKLHSDLGALEPTVPAKQYDASLVAQWSDLAKASGLTLSGAMPDADQAAQLLRGGPISPWHRWKLTVSGHYDGLLKLLAGLQQAPKAISLLALEVRAAGDDDGRLEADVTILAREIPGILPPTPLVSPLTGGVWRFDPKHPERNTYPREHQPLSPLGIGQAGQPSFGEPPMGGPSAGPPSWFQPPGAPPVGGPPLGAPPLAGPIPPPVSAGPTAPPPPAEPGPPARTPPPQPSAAPPKSNTGEAIPGLGGDVAPAEDAMPDQGLPPQVGDVQPPGRQNVPMAPGGRRH